MRCFLLSALFFVTYASQVVFAAPKNVIILIGDGMGMAEIGLARNYEFDGGRGLFLDTMDFHGTAIVNALRETDPSRIAFVGDSASGGTVLATGKRTSVRRISTTAKYGEPIKTIVEDAKEKGLKTGIVTTAVITDATPASFTAHATNRYCMKPGDAPCQGDKPIIEQMLDLEIDVMLGGGYILLPPLSEGETIEQKALDKGYIIAKDRDALLNSSITDNKKLWGIFADYHLPVELRGFEGRTPQVLKAKQGEEYVTFPEAKACEMNPAHRNVPTIEDMTTVALNKLNAVAAKDDTGFFLMIEGASIDKEAHKAQPCGTIGEMLAFDRAVKIATDYAREKGDTLVIVTADHGGATQTIHHPYYENYQRTEENIPGLYELLVSKGGNEMAVYYGTNNASDQAHTGINVPVYSYGLPQDNPLRGTIRQTDIYGVMYNFLFE